MGHAREARRLAADLQRAKLGALARNRLATVIRIALSRWWQA